VRARKRDARKALSRDSRDERPRGGRNEEVHA